LSAAERHVLSTFADLLRQRYGEQLARLVVLGSRARGDVSDDSDIDVLVVLDVPIEQEASAVDAVCALVTEAKRCEPAYVPISTIVMASSRYGDLLRTERRLALDAEREGIAL